MSRRRFNIDDQIEGHITRIRGSRDSNTSNNNINNNNNNISDSESVESIHFANNINNPNRIDSIGNIGMNTSRININSLNNINSFLPSSNNLNNILNNIDANANITNDNNTNNTYINNTNHINSINNLIENTSLYNRIYPPAGTYYQSNLRNPIINTTISNNRDRPILNSLRMSHFFREERERQERRDRLYNTLRREYTRGNLYQERSGFIRNSTILNKKKITIKYGKFFFQAYKKLKENKFLGMYIDSSEESNHIKLDNLYAVLISKYKESLLNDSKVMDYSGNSSENVLSIGINSSNSNSNSIENNHESILNLFSSSSRVGGNNRTSDLTNQFINDVSNINNNPNNKTNLFVSSKNVFFKKIPSLTFIHKYIKETKYQKKFSYFDNSNEENNLTNTNNNHHNINSYHSPNKSSKSVNNQSPIFSDIRLEFNNTTNPTNLMNTNNTPISISHTNLNINNNTSNNTTNNNISNYLDNKNNKEISCFDLMANKPKMNNFIFLLFCLSIYYDYNCRSNENSFKKIVSKYFRYFFSLFFPYKF